MSDAPGDSKPKPIFKPDDAEPSAAPLIDFGADAKADAAKADAKADAAKAAAKADAAKAEAKADADKAEAQAAKADAKAPTGTATGQVGTDSEFAGREVVYVQAPVPPRRPEQPRDRRRCSPCSAPPCSRALFAGAVIVAFFLRATRRR